MQVQTALWRSEQGSVVRIRLTPNALAAGSHYWALG